MARSKYSLLNKKKIQVVRRSGPQYDSITGYPIDTSEEKFDIKGHYYPLDDYRKSLLPEGLRAKSVKRLHTPYQYLLRSVADNSYPDRVLINGETYEVQSRETFDMGVLDHHEYLLVRLEDSGGAEYVTNR